VNKTERMARALEKANPGLTVERGGRHRKIRRGGQLLGILPRTLRTEGLNHDLRTQLTGHGVTLP
jgi:hypothetical protein